MCAVHQLGDAQSGGRGWPDRSCPSRPTRDASGTIRLAALSGQWILRTSLRNLKPTEWKARRDTRLALSIYLLGGFHVSVGPRLVQDSDWRPRKTKNLVKLLALGPWPWPPASPRASHGGAPARPGRSCGQ
jgi:hypothetical protein